MNLILHHKYPYNGVYWTLAHVCHSQLLIIHYVSDHGMNTRQKIM